MKTVLILLLSSVFCFGSVITPPPSAFMNPVIQAKTGAEAAAKMGVPYIGRPPYTFTTISNPGPIDTTVVFLYGLSKNWVTITNDGHGAYIPGGVIDVSSLSGKPFYTNTVSKSYTNGTFGIRYDNSITTLAWLTNSQFPLTLDVANTVASGIAALYTFPSSDFFTGYLVDGNTINSPTTNGTACGYKTNLAYGAGNMLSGITNKMQDFRSIVNHYQPTLTTFTNVTLMADTFVTDTNQGQFGGGVFITNMTILGNNSAINFVSTNISTPPMLGPITRLCVNGSCVLDGLILTNVFDSPANVPTLSPGLCTNLVCRNCQIYGKSGVSMWLTCDNSTNYFTNCLFYASNTNMNENSFNVYLTAAHQLNVFSNCVFSSFNPQTFECVEPSATDQTNYFAGCKFFNTNAPFAGILRTNQILADTSSDCRFTNCQFYANQDSGAFFDRSNVDGMATCALYHPLLANGVSVSLYVSCFFDLGYNGSPMPLGEIVDAVGGLTSFGNFQFINCTVWPNSSIFYNNGFPLTVVGGNLGSSNFSEPARVTFK